MTSKSLPLFCAFFLAAVAAAPAQVLTAELNGRLVELKNNNLVPAAASDLAQAKYIALYFSAGWCPPCHVFTPKLVSFYREMKPKHPDFEVIFISADHSESEMKKYVADAAMPWPALRYSFAKSSHLNKYAGPGIPCLVLLNASGEVLSDSFVGNDYVGPYKVMHALENLLTDGATSDAAPASAMNPSPTPASKSPSGTDWDEAFKKKSP